MDEITALIKSEKNDLLRVKLKDNPSLVNTKTEQGISLLQFAAYCKNKEAIDMIRSYLNDLDIFEAASIGEKEILLRSIEKEPDQINKFANDGFTPLGLASFFGQKDLVKIMLDKGADPNIASNNAFKVTPLHAACAISNYEIAEMLIKNGADVNAKQMQGITPLHASAHNSQLNLSKLLVENGANLNSKMDNGQTPLNMAEETGFKALIEFLKENGGQ